jgi:ectoine hydroxylase-related dioxygenase (phytanoyl-CoA dioxygenase family)
MIETAHLPETLRGEEQPGFAVYPGFAEKRVGEAMLDEVTAIARRAAGGRDVQPALVLQETQEGFSGEQPEDLVSKIFRLHRRGSFRAFLSDPRITRILVDAIGADVDCFLSQFIFKNPGAWGQPWHQDSFYFPFEPARPIVGLWLAVTEATLENGCLHVLPGSQREPVHQHIPDARPNSLYGYVEIVDHDMSRSQPCLLRPGDLMVFDSHLMHRSTDNVSNGLRAAMVWHFARSGTVDHGYDIGGGQRRTNPVHDWLPLLRDGSLIDGNSL